MPSPAERQPAMAAALLDPARPGPGDPRFAVHRNNVVAGLVEALAKAYPAVKLLVGDDFFAGAAREFLRAHPPRSPVLLAWGDAFPGWIAAFPPAAGLRWLPDVARLERACRRAYHAADAAPLAAAALADLPPEALPGLRVTLHPSFTLIRSQFPIVSIWRDVTGPRSGDVDMTRAEAALVVRPETTVGVHAIAPPAAAFLARLAAGDALADAAEAARAAHPAFDLGEEIGALFRLGLLAAAHPPAPETPR